MSPPSPHRREIALVALATLAGLVLRGWDLPRLGLDHFDEGIYALGGLWITSPRGVAALDPGLIPYAPPLQPLLIGLSYLALGVSDTSAILVSILAGTATIPVVAWLARRAFGPGTGAAAAWLCALSGPHVAFSRTALTDALALLTFLVALGLGMRFLERPTLLRSLVFGLAVGLAQNAKYNGFLAGVIIAAAWLAGLLRASLGGKPQELFPPPPGGRAGERGRGGPQPIPPHAGPSPLFTLALGLLAASVAAACYGPWFAFVQSQPGGYAALMRHHAGYVKGAASWPHALWLQLDQSVALSGRLASRLSWVGLAWAGAWVAAAISHPTPAAGRSERARRRIGLVAGAVALAVAPNLAWWLALAAFGALSLSATPARGVLAVGWATMSALTPLYHPYARLWLPVEALTWILLAGTITSWRSAEIPLPDAPRRRVALALLLACVALGLAQRFARRPPPAPLPGHHVPTDAYRLAVAALPPDPSGRPLRVLARPPILFYLARRGLPFVRLESATSLLGSARLGDRALIDGELLDRERGPASYSLTRDWTVQPEPDIALSLPAALDADPSLATRDSPFPILPGPRLLLLKAKDPATP
jgi:hypothetical protein